VRRQCGSGKARGRRQAGPEGLRAGVPAPASAGRGRRVAAVLLVLLVALAAALVAPVPAAWAAKKKSSSSKTSSKPAATRSPVLTGIRHWTGPESTRLVLDLSRPTRFTTVTDTVGLTVTLKLAGAVPSPSLTSLREVGDGAVRTIRVSETPAGIDVEIAVNEIPAAEPFSVDDGGGTSPRLVLDVPRPGRAARQAEQQRVVRELSGEQVRVVVIDPGHGGEHTGAIGPQHTIEKEVCLSIARKLAARLDREPGVRAFLTRDSDYNVALRERYHQAERLQADAFVSIHANSGRRRNGRGTEVYFLSLDSASDEQAKHLAELENAADMVGGVPPAEEDLVSILFDLKQNEVLHQSAILAEAVLDEITGARQLENRGVKQAPFAVLKSPTVPSILVETAFINHPAEAKLLRDPGFQEDLAGQMARGVLRYLADAPLVARSAPSDPPGGSR
jgi:N-acetylmuramoyl-L-alanine amidase